MEYSEFTPLNETQNKNNIKLLKLQFLELFKPLKEIKNFKDNDDNNYKFYYNNETDLIYKFSLDDGSYCKLKYFDPEGEEILRKINNLS